MSFTVDSRGNRSGQYLEQRKPDVRARILRLYILFATIVLIGALITTYFLQSRMKENVIAHDLALARDLVEYLELGPSAVPIQVELEKLVEISGIDGPVTVMLLDDTREILAIDQRDVTINSSFDWSNWQRLVTRTASFDRSGSFFTNDPDGQEWLHSYATFPSSENKLIVQRPTADAFSTSRLFIGGILVAVIIYLLGGIFSWAVLTNQVIRPLEQLERYSERIRWRGRLSSTERRQIDKLKVHEDQLGNLASSLAAMQQETEQRLVQLATLLETGRVVASSLDSTAVFDNIFNQVQTLFGVTRCAVVVLDQRAEVFRIRASRGLSENYTKQLRIAPSEPNSPSMRALRNETPIQVADTNTDLAFVNLQYRAQKEGFRSVLAIPLATQFSPPAVLLLYKSDPYRYSYSEIELASSFGHHASIALENAALFAKTDEQLQEQTRRLEAIVESLSDGLILEGPSGKVLYCNQRALTLLRLPRSQAQAKTSTELIHLLLADQSDPEWVDEKVFDRQFKSRSHALDLALQNGRGKPRDLRIHFFDVNDEQGELLGRGQVWQDITKDKEIDRMKSALLSTVSHELRTPLATIKGFATTLLADDVKWDEAAQREFLEAISLETDRLTRLVQNLLDMSRIEARVLTIQCERYSLNELISQVVRGFGSAIDNPISDSELRDLPPVWMDVSRISTVIRNLIENAAKYAGPDMPIEIATWNDNGSVLMSVRDYGPGIPSDLQQKVFDRFYRVENGLTRRVGGTGLGLAICKGFIDAHGGTIWVRDANPGAAFIFSLPIDHNCNEG